MKANECTVDQTKALFKSEFNINQLLDHQLTPDQMKLHSMAEELLLPSKGINQALEKEDA